ncbi:DUF1499 domain-containing protein [Pseudoroseicyclus aestuarii]|uniref:Uncharacterized protein DUF1499 n=1 Tax=Pseudoroseicyclus aestuarii TaxID=1795041 RepID=A0A318SNP8_9RHOB|nr:DUF1499 domain-containing protein [Pseudoroseicyclus aestuarii]PYE82316.1 uncharacterized protein DUF1499 [Pseudoroseicyclus aestuarii]
MIKTLAVGALAGCLGTAAWIRLAPSDPAVWHEAAMPETAPRPPREGGWLVRPEGGNAAAPVYAGTPHDLLARFDRVVVEDPATQRLFGSVDENRVTYVSRSRLMGFPDYTTVQALPAPGGATLAIWARNRFGASDMGVNRGRVERWLAALGLGRGAAPVQP